MDHFDIIIIGAGIAGASVAAHLAAERRVVLLDMEERPGLHSTGRSAASFEPNYGPPPILALTRTSAHFFNTPPQGFCEGPLFAPRPSLFFAAEGQEKHTEHLLANAAGLTEISEDDAMAILPPLRRGYAKRSFCDNATGDLDVDLLHRGYLKLLRHRNGAIVTSAEVTGLADGAGGWTVATKAGLFAAPIVINAAGAWGDVIARLGGIKPMKLQPKRRSIGVVPVDGYHDLMDWPMATDVGETWYAKPQSGKLIVSSADATPVDPHDAYADDMAIAEGVDRLMTATVLLIDRLEHSWGGLRTFAPDGNPVVGFDPQAEGFFWLVGQGGYGIQTAPALSEAAAAMVLGKPLPISLVGHGFDPQHVSPLRFS